MFVFCCEIVVLWYVFVIIMCYEIEDIFFEICVCVDDCVDFILMDYFGECEFEFGCGYCVCECDEYFVVGFEVCFIFFCGVE